MRKLIYIFFLLFLPSVAFAYSGLAVGLEVGYGPNMMEMDRDFESLKEADDRIVQKAVEVKDYYGDRVVISDIKTSGGQLVSVPIGINMRYVYKRLFFKFGFLYHVILPNRKSYVLNSRAGVDANLSASGSSHNFYQDNAKNADSDLTNDVPQAFGLVATDGRDFQYQSVVTAQMIEVPFTIGLILIGKEFYKFYIGAGMTFFTGRSNRTITVKERTASGDLQDISGANSQADIDEFQGNSVGFHFLLGSEFQMTKKVGIYGEFSFSIGAAVPLLDRVRTGATTATSLFHAAQASDQAGLDTPGSEVPGSATRPGLPRPSGISFRYFRFSMGVSYNIHVNRPVRRKLKKKRRRVI